MRLMGLLFISVALVSMGWGSAAGEPLRRELVQERDFPARPFPRKEPAHGVFPQTRAPRETTGTSASGEGVNLEEMTRHLRARGFGDITDVRRLGEHFVVRARGRSGQDLTLVVNARTHEVAGMRVRGR